MYIFSIFLLQSILDFQNWIKCNSKIAIFGLIQPTIRKFEFSLVLPSYIISDISLVINR